MCTMLNQHQVNYFSVIIRLFQSFFFESDLLLAIRIALETTIKVAPMSAPIAIQRVE